jgi:uncharacterized protein (TIGR02453 family)
MAKTSLPCFPPETITFLRALARNNDREWFKARKDRYDAEVKAPMVAVVEALDRDFRAFAPELDANPKRAIYRIYRDTRFSPDKTPLKTHIGAYFPHRDLGKADGAGLYLHVEPKAAMFAGGLYAPMPPQLRALRGYIADNAMRFRSIVEAPAFAKAFAWEGDALTRVPRGYPADHAAAEYLKCKRFVGWVEHPAAFATTGEFYPALVKAFKLLLPLVRFINDAMLATRRMEIR